MKRIHRIFLKHDKNTENIKTAVFPLPETVSISMSQTMGAPCEVLVEPGDNVTVGQKIGDTEAFMSAPVHSSVSGIVLGISDYLMANGKVCKTVIIKTDGKQLLCKDIKPPLLISRSSYIEAVRASGACGLGGAGFPTHVKLAFDETKTPVDTLVINAAECEPYITSDYREMIEHPDDIYEGIREMLWHMKIPKAKICIENNKPEAIQKLRSLSNGNPAINVIELPSSYPQGAEKMVIYSATERILQEGQLPLHQKVLVMNVSTIGFLKRYMKSGVPLIHRRITVDGTAVQNPCNIEIPIGTPISEILKYVKATDVRQLISGGPMMGTCLYDTSAPITKTHNAILAMKEAPTAKETSPCIRCGMCIRSCPLNLMPTMLEEAFRFKDVETLTKLKVNMCMNCGSCTYVCPANRPLAESNQLAKALLTQKKN